MTHYNRLNPLHWIVALFSNSRKSDYLKAGTLHVAESEYKATQRIHYWIRNPAHDFMSYIIGFSGDPEFRTAWGDATDRPTGWTVAVRRWRWLFLPYVCYTGAVMVQFGWRQGGNFGIKIRKVS